jgi:hypothetical protein
MSAKATTAAKAKTGPKSTKAVAAKPVSSAKSMSPPRMTEQEKKADTENYILNPNTGKMVKRDTPNGKKLVEAEKTGAEIPKMMTDTQRLILVVQTLRDIVDLDDAVIKAALKTVEEELPRSFPSIWGGKQKEARHADHPKGPSNAYIYYTKAIRPSTKDANPELSSKELITLMAKMWKETAEDDRAEYEAQALIDKERYETEMAVFEAAHPELARSSTKSVTSPGKPTKATAYGMFCDANRQMVKDENPELEGKAVTKILAEKWAELKKDHAKEADKYQVEADQANADFEERTKQFYSSPGSSPKLSKAEQAKADDPEHYELNTETGRYKLKDGWNRNPDGSFVKKEAKAASPKKTKKVQRPAAKAAMAKIEKIVSEEEASDDELVA